MILKRRAIMGIGADKLQAIVIAKRRERRDAFILAVGFILYLVTIVCVAILTHPHS